VTGSPAFLDTVGLLAVWDRKDSWHELADNAYRELEAERVLLYTSSLVLLECANAAARRPYRDRVTELRRRLQAKGLLLEPTAAETEEAWFAYGRGNVGGPGVVDLISFQLMRRVGIRRALTNDRHFREAGFEILFEV
jgi:predicted nucleic acid-binding protein